MVDFTKKIHILRANRRTKMLKEIDDKLSTIRFSSLLAAYKFIKDLE